METTNDKILNFTVNLDQQYSEIGKTDDVEPFLTGMGAEQEEFMDIAEFRGYNAAWQSILKQAMQFPCGL